MIVFENALKQPFSPVKVAFLTGLSEPQHCFLSEVQSQFLKRLHIEESWKVYLNFPYIASPHLTTQRTTPLVQASIANAHQFLLASKQAYRVKAAEHLKSMAASTEQLILLTGSCGLEILNHALSDEVAAKLRHVIAFGPVAQRTPVVPYSFVQGANDYLSQCFFRQVDVKIRGQGHMNYLQNEKVFEFINEAVCSNTLS